MPVTYALGVKGARMTATRDRFAGGSLELLSAGSAAVLARFTLSAGGGTVTNDVWTITFADANNTVQGLAAAGAGTDAAVARLVRSAANGSTVELTGLTVGDTGSGADIILTNANIATGQDVVLSGASITHAA